ncbi:MAG: hypothetical protein J6L69_06725 [Lachnospiraceae bacterium]|nr:hypothetical protein [Lachnospiraceae bacterium]
MSLITIKETIEKIEAKNKSMPVEDKQYVVQFAFKTNDKELTESLLDELSKEESDREAVKAKYDAIIDLKPKWLEHIENLLVAIEMYRLEEKKASQRLVELLKAHNIDVSIEELRCEDTSIIKERVVKSMSL